MTPDVGVVIPTRNRCRLFEHAVRSALGQQGVAVQVIVIDEASDDGTAGLLDTLGDRVEVIAHDTPRGVARSRNEGLERVTAPWVAFLDDDDVWAPDWLATALATAGREDAGLVYGTPLLIDPERHRVGEREPVDPALAGGDMAGANRIGGPSMAVIRTGSVRRAGGFDPAFHALADWDLWLRLVKDVTLARAPGLRVGYTVHHGNMHLTDPDAVLEEFQRFARRHADAPLSEASFLDWLIVENVQAGNRANALRLHVRRLRLGARTPGSRGTKWLLWSLRRAWHADRTDGPDWLAAYRADGTTG